MRGVLIPEVLDGMTPPLGYSMLTRLQGLLKRMKDSDTEGP